jgi:pimeloyl-ACP methyl ester carboxylesterase
MTAFWRRHRALRITSYVILALVLVICVVPYLIPLGQPGAGISPDDLVGDHGRFLDIDGLPIYIEEQNPESTQTAIVFIHGFGGSSFSWRDTAPFFAGRGYRVATLDLKGFGLSYKDSASDYSHAAQARLVAEVLAGLEIDRAYFVAHSMGTSVMLHFAHLYPDRVLGLVSVDGAVNLEQHAVNPSALLRFPPFRRAAEVFLTRYATKERIGRILKSAYYRQEVVTEEVMAGYYSRLVVGQWAQSLLAMTRDMSANTITFALEDLDFPALILWGQNDTWVRRADIDRWKDEIPSAEFQAIPEAGHMLMEEYPDLFNGLVLAFLHSHGG